MQKSTNELEPGDRIIIPTRGLNTPATPVRVRSVRTYIPGIMETFARAEGHDRVIFFDHEPKPGQSFSLAGDITVPSTATWMLA